MEERTSDLLEVQDVTAFIPALQSPDPEVQLAGLEALLALPVKSGAWNEVGMYCLFVLRGIEAQADSLSLPTARQFIQLAVAVPVIEVREAIRHLAFSDHREARAALYALGWAGDQEIAFQLLSDLQNWRMAEQHIACAEALSYLDVSDNQAAVLRLCLEHSDPTVRFFLSLPLARMGSLEGFTRLIQDISRSAIDLWLLSSDPDEFAKVVLERGPYPENFKSAIEQLVDVPGVKNLNALLRSLQTTESRTASSQHAVAADEPEKARDLAQTWLENPPFSARESITPLQGRLLSLLDGDLRLAVQTVLLDDLRVAFRASERYRAGNILVQLPAEVWQGEGVVELLIEHYVRLGYSDALYKTQLSWLLAKQGLPSVIPAITKRIQSTDDELRQITFYNLARDVGSQVDKADPPVYQPGRGHVDKLRPPRYVLANIHAMDAIGPEEMAMGNKSVSSEPDLTARYANAKLLESDEDVTPDNSQPMTPKAIYRLRVNIGALQTDSDVENAAPIPIDLLPDEDLWLEIMLSSSVCEVGLNRASLGERTTASVNMLLPRDGGSARAEDGKKNIDLWLRIPDLVGIARARLSIYYHNHLVQSFLFRAWVNEIPDDVNLSNTEMLDKRSSLCSMPPLTNGYALRRDFSLSHSLVDVAGMPKRTQVSILTNDNGSSGHQIVVRQGDANGEAIKRVTYALRFDEVSRIIGKIRKVLRDESPTRELVDKRKLVRTLKELAPLGWNLRNLLGPGVRDVKRALRDDPDAVIQIVRPNSTGAVFPWGMVYDIPISEHEEPELCPMIKDWDGDQALDLTGLHACPCGHTESNMLCPFGFWAYRYPIEQLASDEDGPVLHIPVLDGMEMTAGLAQYGLDIDDLDTHIDDLADVVAKVGIAVNTARSRDEVKRFLGHDQPLVYMYCHGETYHATDLHAGATYLGMGNREKFTTNDFTMWLDEWDAQDRYVWHKVRPLIFINACHSADFEPDHLMTYLDAFVGWAHAAGMIGTEVRVDQSLAMTFATLFYEGFVQGQSVSQSLHNARMYFLAKGNLFGLLYSAYCLADLKLDLPLPTGDSEAGDQV